jgi:hypothetical protein
MSASFQKQTCGLAGSIVLVVAFGRAHRPVE